MLRTGAMKGQIARAQTQDRGSRGFILALTLWIIALFGLGVAAINTWVSLAVDNARALKQRADAEVALSNTTNEIIYAMGTRPMTRRGLEVGTDLKRPAQRDMLEAMTVNFESEHYIAFDDRPYSMQSDANYAVRIQDGRGLINLNIATPQMLDRLLTIYGAPETLRNQLPDTLADWTDEDDLTRLAGAERDDYERRNRLPPSNVPLMTPLEAQNVLGWDEVPQLWEADQKSPLLTTCTVAGFNPNTAPETVLMTNLPGLTEPAAAQAIARREENPFEHARDFMDSANVTVPNEAFFFGVTPGNCVIVDFIDRTTGEDTRFSLSLNPFSTTQPWQVDYAYRIPSQYRRPADKVDPKVAFPTPETIDPGLERNDGTAGSR